MRPKSVVYWEAMHTPLALYDLEGEFLGWVIGKRAENGNWTLHNDRVWTEADQDDFSEQIARLNDQGNVLAYWPDARDPEVQALLADESWEPVDRIPTEVPDNEKSVFIYREPPREEDGFPGSVDEENSIIVMKTVMVPSPADTLARVKKACELIARKRANA